MSENPLQKAEDLVGRAFGDLECLVHHPLYFISNYQARVDEHLIRGSWPSSTELLALHRQGVTGIANLCAERQQSVGVIGLVGCFLSIVDNTPPSLTQARAFLMFVDSQKLTYVHCEQGKGRTGCMVAAYRVARNGWTAEAALKEAEGFGLAFPDQKEWIASLTKDALD